LVVSDQLNWEYISAMGNSYVKTTNIDRLCETGVRFERAYAINPVSIPSRIGMFTGARQLAMSAIYEKKFMYFKFWTYFVIVVFSICLLFGCSKETPINEHKDTDLKPSRVELVQRDDQWQLLRNDEPFYIHGVAAGASTYKEERPSCYYGMLADCGGNAIRTYGVNEDTKNVLDGAYTNGITVALGLWVNKESQGFNYNDPVAINSQLKALQQQVRSFKNHPALLMWIVGNEVDAQYSTLTQKQQMWTAVNNIHKMIHEEDGNHPTTTAIINASREKLDDIKRWVPNMDILSSNTKHQQVPGVLTNLQDAGWTKPYILSEYGPRGMTQLNPVAERILEWGGLVEQTSTEKEQDYLDVYQNHVIPNQNNGCLGSFAFVWGYQTNGAIATWYGTHNLEGLPFGVVNALQFCWTGQYPENRAPRIDSREDMLLNGKRAEDNIKILQGSANKASVIAIDPEGDVLEYNWMISPERGTSPDGGPHPGLPRLIQTNGNSAVTFIAPTYGAYRLYVYVKDTKNNMASAVIPFLVE